MGWSIKYPFGKNSVVSNALTVSTKAVTNPVSVVNKAFNLKIPDSIKIGGTSIGLDPLDQVKASLRDVKNAGRQASVDWKNAGRGEIGKFVSTGTQGVYTMTMALPRAISSGDWEKEAQRFYGGSRAALSPLENMIGKNQGWQDALRNQDAWYNKWSGNTFKNFAGQTRGHAQMESSGTLSNADRNDWTQLSVKAGAVVAAIFGGAAAYGAYSGSGAAAGGGAAASGAGGAGLTLPTLGSSYGGASAGYGLGVGSLTGATSAGTTAAAAGGGFWSTTGTIAGTSLLSRLVGGGGGGVQISGIGGASDGGLYDQIGGLIGDLFGGGGGGSGGVARGPAYVTDPQASYSMPEAIGENPVMSLALIAGLGVGAWYVYKKVV